MYFGSCCIGFINKIIETPNSTFVFTGDDDNYKCELVPGDRIFLINHLGYSVDDILMSVNVEEKTIELEKTGTVNVHSNLFLGRVDN